MAVFYMNTVKPNGHDASYLTEEDLNEEKYVLKVPKPKDKSNDFSFDEKDDFSFDDEEINDFGDKDISNTDDDFSFDDVDNDSESNDDDPDKQEIESLTGKIAQKLRDYSNENETDPKLEKFVINSIISALHFDEMDEKDINDIIKKIENNEESTNKDNDDDFSFDDLDDDSNIDKKGEEEEAQIEEEDLIIDVDDKKNTKNSDNLKKNPIFVGKNDEQLLFDDMELERMIDELWGNTQEEPTETPTITEDPITTPAEPSEEPGFDPFNPPRIDEDPDPKGIK